MLFFQSKAFELSLEDKLKEMECRILYQKTGNEIYNILADSYAKTQENLIGNSKILTTEEKED